MASEGQPATYMRPLGLIGLATLIGAAIGLIVAIFAGEAGMWVALGALAGIVAGLGLLLARR